MNWYDNLLIIAGISLDIFAAMEIQGAMLADVKKKSLVIACVLVTILQLGFFFGGYVICHYLDKKEYLGNAEWVGYIITTIVFGLLGVRLIVKAVKREIVHERCREIQVKDYIKIIAVTSLYTLAAGSACGFVGTNALHMFIIIVICSILVVVSGLYTGYHFGFGSKTVAYVIGAILLWVAGVELLIVNVIA